MMQKISSLDKPGDENLPWSGKDFPLISAGLCLWAGGGGLHASVPQAASAVGDGSWRNARSHCSVSIF